MKYELNVAITWWIGKQEMMTDYFKHIDVWELCSVISND